MFLKSQQVLPQDRTNVKPIPITNSNFQFLLSDSVGNPDPEPDPPVFGPPGSRSIIQRYGSGSFLMNVLTGVK